MSRVDRYVLRKQEGNRKVRKSQRTRRYWNAKTSKIEDIASPFHRKGDRWWRLRFADLVDRRTTTKRKNGHNETTYSLRPGSAKAKAAAAAAAAATAAT